jgi:pyridoxamine 5'-phosphate oxidase
MDPINKIIEDRQSARALSDPNANVCFLALSENNQPSVRTLVLRDISDTGFTLFINTTSEKWRTLKKNNRAELLLWFGSVQRQYRVRGHLEELDRTSIARNWPRRPAVSKYLDYAYSLYQRQSGQIESHAALKQEITTLRARQPEESLKTPKTATGMALIPDEIEILDLNDPERIHDRKLFFRDKNMWKVTQLMP